MLFFRLLLSTAVCIVSLVYCFSGLAKKPVGQDLAPSAKLNEPDDQSPKTEFSKREEWRVQGGLSGRLESVWKSAPRGPGSVPLIQMEALFADFHSLRSAYLEAAAANARSKYDPFLAQIGASLSDVDRFYKFLHDAEVAWTELHSALGKGSASADHTQLRAMENVLLEKAVSDIKEMLGQHGAVLFDQYKQTLTARTRRIGLKALVLTSYYNENPITQKNFNKIAELVSDTDLFPSTPSQDSGKTEGFSFVRKEAAKYLTPHQLEVFDLLLDHQDVSLARGRVLSERSASGTP